jgi:hypothetical protein
MLYNKQYKWQDDLIHQVGLSFFKKDWVIKEIVYHPLKFARRRMEDPESTRPIRIRYFGAFVPKTSKTKEDVAKYKEIYRSYKKYKNIVSEMGYRTDTEKNYMYDMMGLALRNKWYIIDRIWRKGLVLTKEELEMQQIETLNVI